MTENELKKSAAFISIVYALFGALWILLSDKILAYTVGTGESFRQLQTYKGWFYVAITALLVYVLVEKLERKLLGLNKDLSHKNSQLEKEALRKKQVRDDYYKSDQQYSLVFHNSPLGMFHFDRQGNIINCNEIMARIMGTSREKLLGFNLSKEIRDERMKKALQEGLAGRIGTFEGSYFAVSSGKQVNIKTVFKGIFSESDKFLGGVGIVEDITQRNAAEAEAERTRQMLFEILQGSSVATLVIDKDHKILYWNKAIENLTGIKSEEMLGTSRQWKAFYPNNRPILADCILAEKGEQLIHDYYTDKCKRSELIEGAWEGQDFFPNIGEKGKWLYFTAAAIKDREGKVVGAIETLHDITEAKEVSREREELLKTLAHKNEELESIIYVSSHDLRSPVVNIQGFAGELRRSCTGLAAALETLPAEHEINKRIHKTIEEEINTSIDFISSSVRKMADLQEGLLKLCRLGFERLDRRHIDMNVLVREIVDSMQFNAVHSGAEISVGNLPPCTADQSQLTQVFTNLIDNGLKYLDSSRRGKISITGSEDKNMSLYRIEDNGVGVPEEFQEKIFEVFHRLDPDSQTPGEGIGLTVARRIVNNHGGTISVQSQVGQGSVFTVSLPRES